jgi:ATP-dependent DNA helicase RecQ
VKLRDFQIQALETLKNPHHLLCIAPTGSGKSRIFDEHLLRSSDRALLITPLKALERQHASRLEQLGISVSDRTDAPGTQVTLMNPERLALLASTGRQSRWNFLIVDECHTIWEWGRAFRPDFDLVPDWIKPLGIQRSLWLSATLHAPSLQAIYARLPHPKSLQGAFTLPSTLDLRVIPLNFFERGVALQLWLERHPEPGLIYVNSRRLAERLAHQLTQKGYPSRAYHAGLALEEKLALERALASGAVVRLVCTSAFGMGMDVPQLAWVVLYQAPRTLLALAQAIGRVARNGREGCALVFWSDEDFPSARGIEDPDGKDVHTWLKRREKTLEFTLGDVDSSSTQKRD